MDNQRICCRLTFTINTRKFDDHKIRAIAAQVNTALLGLGWEPFVAAVSGDGKESTPDIGVEIKPI